MEVIKNLNRLIILVKKQYTISVVLKIQAILVDMGMDTMKPMKNMSLMQITVSIMIMLITMIFMMIVAHTTRLLYQRIKEIQWLMMDIPSTPARGIETLKKQ